MSKKKFSKEILSIDFEDDDKVGYAPFNQFLENHTNRIRNTEADAITAMGESLLMEIDHKNSVKDVTKNEQIDYIVNKTSKYSREYLLELDYNDVIDIFNEVKAENKSFFTKLLEFFNLSHH